jgi:pimeloyl-ACP methyl ester carboxylesterase
MGVPEPGVPPVVAVMGMAVANYFMPALAALAEWTETHLVELPGFGGSDEPRYEPDARGYGETVAAFLSASGLPPVVLAGHSSGTQDAAHAAACRPDLIAGLVLASPTLDPKTQSWLRMLFWWKLDGRYPTPGLKEIHTPDRRRAGPRRLWHVIHVHLKDHLEDTIPTLRMPVLVLRGESDRLCTEEWARGLAESAPEGRFLSLRGPHNFLWVDPEVWSEPVRNFARQVAVIPKDGT